MRILALLIPLMIASSCAEPTLRVASSPNATEAGRPITKLRTFCWAQYTKDGTGHTIIYFVFNENSEVTYFCNTFVHHVVGRDGRDQLTTNIASVIKEGGREGVRLTLNSGNAEPGGLKMRYGKKVTDKRIDFIIDGKEYPPTVITFPPLKDKEDEGRWVFEITKGVEQPDKPDTIIADPRKFMKRQYEKNR